MSEIHLLPQNERELFFRAAIDTKDMPQAGQAMALPEKED